MTLFKCHAVVSCGGGARSHLVRTYVTMASTWQEARACIRDQDPCAEFVTVPVEISGALMVDIKLISEREFAALRSACEWNEDQLCDGHGPLGHGGRG